MCDLKKFTGTRPNDTITKSKETHELIFDINSWFGPWSKFANSKKPEKMSDWEYNHAYGSHAVAPQHRVCCTPSLTGNIQF